MKYGGEVIMLTPAMAAIIYRIKCRGSCCGTCCTSSTPIVRTQSGIIDGKLYFPPSTTVLQQRASDDIRASSRSYRPASLARLTDGLLEWIMNRFEVTVRSTCSVLKVEEAAVCGGRQ